LHLGRGSCSKRGVGTNRPAKVPSGKLPQMEELGFNVPLVFIVFAGFALGWVVHFITAGLRVMVRSMGGGDPEI